MMGRGDLRKASIEPGRTIESLLQGSGQKIKKAKEMAKKSFQIILDSIFYFFQIHCIKRN
jgi:hypothetical protein